MLAFLLGFLGLGVAAGGAGGGGGGSKPQVASGVKSDVVALPPGEDTPEEDPVVVEDVVEDDTSAGEDRNEGDQAAEVVGPCPKTGEAVCHCGDDDDDNGDTGSDVVGPCPKTGEAVCHCNDEDNEDDGHDHAGHDGHAGHGDHVTIPLPQTSEEIEAFVAAVRASPETHSHDMGSSMAGEHMAAMDLVPRDEATHIAIGNGDWDDPSNWHNGEVPGDDAKVLIPEGVHMTYDHVSAASLFTVRVDGHLDFATDVDSKMVVDTLVISPSGALTIGTEDDPVAPDVNVDIIFANNGPIDTDWDPMLLSRGMIAHGKTTIHGAEKDSHEKVVDDPMAGDTWVDFGTVPDGWAVGDTIIVAGTRYEGYYDELPQYGFSPSEDEIRVITDIDDGMVFFDEPLEFDHDTPREDLKTSVANYTRNISFETEDAVSAEIFERAHVMFMHSDDVDVRYAEFHELGRTDKSEIGVNAGDVDDIAFDTNVKGRYSFHFHRTGVDNLDEPAIAIGNSVYGSPGWGFVHHDSNAILENNATYDTFGAGYVAESGNETGAWNDNIAIFAKGNSWLLPKLANGVQDVENFDLGKSGDGFWFQGRMVESTDNIAASVNHGFVYFHRGPIGESGQIQFDSDVSDISAALKNGEYVSPDKHPILEFSGNEAFASNRGLAVVKANPNQGHDIHSVLEDFTAWSVHEGAFFEYTAHYSLIDFDVIGKEETALSGQGATGIDFGNRVTDFTIVDAKIDNFNVGIDLTKEGFEPEQHEYLIVNPTFANVLWEYDNYDPARDEIINTADLPDYTPDLQLNGPLTYKDGNPYETPEDGEGFLILDGQKTDSLGVTGFPSGTDNYTLLRHEVANTMEREGYYTTSDGQDFFMLDVYFSDRLNGDIYVETHPVFLDDNVIGRPQYSDVQFNGVLDLGGPNDPTSEAATLWATLTEGQLVLTDEAIAMQEEEWDLDAA